VWVDDAGYVRQQTFYYSISIPDSVAKIEYRTTVQYSAYGAKPRIALPPSRDVTTIGANG